MKQKRLTKIFLILVIILVACCIKTTSYVKAEEEQDTRYKLINGNKVSLNSWHLKNLSYIFCRDKGSYLNGGGYESNKVIEYPIITYYDDNDKETAFENATKVTVEGADIAYILSKYDKYIKPSNAYGEIQRAYWAVLSQEKYRNSGKKDIYCNFTYNIDDSDIEAKRLYNEALGYQKYIEAVEQQKINNKNKKEKEGIIFSESSELSDGYEIALDTTKKVGNQINDNILTVGPFTAEYARSI